MRVGLTTLFSVVATFSGVAIADTAQINTYSGFGCTGDEVTAYIDHDTTSCFEGLGGNSIGGFSSDQQSDTCSITTWSGSNCAGSSSEFPDLDFVGYGGSTSCTDIPYASISIYCCGSFACLGA